MNTGKENKQLLFIAVDTSGSMEENAKFFIAKNSVRTIEQYCRFGYSRLPFENIEIRLIKWDEKITPLQWHPDRELPAELTQCSGKADIKAMIEFIDSLAPNAKLLLITDGHWPYRELKKFKRVKNSRNGAMRIIKVGSESSDSIDRIGEIFTPESLFDALDGWL